MVGSVKFETNFMKNLGEPKLTSSFVYMSSPYPKFRNFEKLQNTSQHSQYYYKKNIELLFLPILKQIVTSFKKIIINQQNYSKILYKLDWKDKGSTTPKFATQKPKKNQNKTMTSSLIDMNSIMEKIYIVYFLQNEKINKILNENINCESYINDHESSSTLLASGLEIQNFMLVHTTEKKEENKNNCDGKKVEPKSSSCRLTNGYKIIKDVLKEPIQMINGMAMKNNCSDILISIEESTHDQSPPERRRKKRKKKKHQNQSNFQKTINNNVNTINNEKMGIELKQKKKRKKRQRKLDRDSKTCSHNLSNEIVSTKLSNELLPTSKCDIKIAQCYTICSDSKKPTTICVSVKPVSTPLPSSFLYNNHHEQLQHPVRQRQISECSNDSIDICFMDDFNDDDDCNIRYNCYSYKDDTDETNSDSGLTIDEKKVRFNLKPKIHIMRTWDFAHRQARIGDWEKCARDRFRFRDRIRNLEHIISPILSKEHRNKIFCNRFL